MRITKLLVCFGLFWTEVPYAAQANLEPKIILSKLLSARIINVNYYAQFKNTQFRLGGDGTCL